MLDRISEDQRHRFLDHLQVSRQFGIRRYERHTLLTQFLLIAYPVGSASQLVLDCFIDGETAEQSMNQIKAALPHIDPNTVESAVRRLYFARRLQTRSAAGRTAQAGGSIGNHHLGLPELLMIGTCNESALSAIVDVMRKRKVPFSNGEIVEIGGRLPCKIIDVNTDVAKDRYTCQVGEYYRTKDYRIQQVLIPDKQGRFPDNPECAEPYASARMSYEHGGFVPWDTVRGS